MIWIKLFHKLLEMELTSRVKEEAMSGEDEGRSKYVAKNTRKFD